MYHAESGCRTIKADKLIELLLKAPAGARVGVNAVGNLTVFTDDGDVAWIDLSAEEFNPLNTP